MARTRPRKYIALNREDDAWVPGKLDGRKARRELYSTLAHGSKDRPRLNQASHDLYSTYACWRFIERFVAFFFRIWSLAKL